VVYRREGEYVGGLPETQAIILKGPFGVFGLCASGLDK